MYLASGQSMLESRYWLLLVHSGLLLTPLLLYLSGKPRHYFVRLITGWAAYAGSLGVLALAYPGFPDYDKSTAVQSAWFCAALALLLTRSEGPQDF